MDLQELSKKWIELKEAEKLAVESRREVEDAIMKLANISETLEGTENINLPEAMQIKIVGRMNRKVDTDKLQEIAQEHGLTDHLHQLFRWKAEINSAVWKAADEAITNPLLGAVTTTPGRPSFAVIVRE